jgi:uncharacterized protein YecE (DUF72 family)
MIRIGTAGWAIPRTVADRFPADGSGLQRYAGRFTCVEINSTFYRSHRPGTLRRWVETTPETFRFAVKTPKAITHDARLADPGERLDRFFGEIAELGAKLGPVLVQLPPSLQFDAAVAGAFFDDLRRRFDGPVACEPRHATWFELAADTALAERRIARVAADPACVPDAATPGGWPGLIYFRLHGSPHMYRSAYEADVLQGAADQLAGAVSEAWCVFDNTTLGAAAADALTLTSLLADRGA